MLKSINPATGKTVQSYEIYSEKGVEKIINSVDKAWHQLAIYLIFSKGQNACKISHLVKKQKRRIGFADGCLKWEKS